MQERHHYLGHLRTRVSESNRNAGQTGLKCVLTYLTTAGHVTCFPLSSWQNVALETLYWVTILHVCCFRSAWLCLWKCFDKSVFSVNPSGCFRRPQRRAQRGLGGSSFGLWAGCNGSSVLSAAQVSAASRDNWSLWKQVLLHSWRYV